MNHPSPQHPGAAVFARVDPHGTGTPIRRRGRARASLRRNWGWVPAYAALVGLAYWPENVLEIWAHLSLGLVLWLMCGFALQILREP